MSFLSGQTDGINMWLPVVIAIALVLGFIYWRVRSTLA